MSNINPNNIDGTFPIAGQDNSSQGFRDNFTNIRNNFSYAQSEIGDLQAKALTTSALSGGTLTNDMDYNQIYRAQLFSPSQTFLNLGTPTGGTTVTLDYAQANFQKFTTNGDYNISFANWPTTGQIGEMTLWVNVTSTDHVLTFTLTSPGVTIGFNDIAGADTTTGQITFNNTGNYCLKFYSSDAGQNIAVRDISRNFATLRDPNLFWDDSITPTLLIGYGANQTSFQTVLGLETGQDAVSAKGSYNSVAVGNVQLANIHYPAFDTGVMGGYTVTSSRGNLQTGTFTATSNGDFLGYLNAVTYTGNVGSGYTFAQVSSIGMYATGTSAVQGLGGNVAIFTHAPGTTSNLMVQAVGIENDQSTKLYGNVTMAGARFDTGYQYYAPTTNFGNYAIYANVARFIMDPTGAITNGNVRLPTVMPDGAVIKISSTQTITNFSVWAGGTTVTPSANVTLTGGTAIEFFYHAGETKWYKVA